MHLGRWAIKPLPFSDFCQSTPPEDASLLHLDINYLHSHFQPSGRPLTLWFLAPPILGIEANPFLVKTVMYKDEELNTDMLEAKSEQCTTTLPEHVTRMNIGRAAWILRMTRHIFSERHSEPRNLAIYK